MFSLSRPTPYVKRGDTAVMQAPTHYITLFHGKEQRNADGEIIVVSGRVQYNTERLYVADGAVYLDEQKRVPMDQLEELYPWFWGEYNKISPSLRREVRLGMPDEQVKQADELSDEFLSTWENLPLHIREELGKKYTKQEPDETPTTFVCEFCEEEHPLNRKGVHMSAKHRGMKKDQE